jgi:hypothetical protein
MQKLHITPTTLTPEIHFSPEENIFLIRGTSSPEDVRGLYYPVIDWIKEFIDVVLKGENYKYTVENPLKFQTDLDYFNSSSAKFLYDIFMELKRLPIASIPLTVEWYYDEEDIDMKEAGSDIAYLAEMEFTYVPKSDSAL